MCEKKRLEVGDQVRETPAYRKWARDREVRGALTSIFGTLATVRNAEGWELSVHKDWLEKDYDIAPPAPIPWQVKWKKPQNYCQHCGEKL